MIPLRAFLLLRNEQGDWDVTVHRELDGILASWKARLAPDQTTGILHVGFDRPPTTAFEKVASTFPGRLLITASAKFSLPKGFECTSEIAGYVEGHPIHLAIKGWGYEVSDEEINSIFAKPNSEPDSPALPIATGWVRTLLDQNPEMGVPLAAARIYDDTSYLSSEANLPHQLRHTIGLARYRALMGTSDTPSAIVAAAPPWLLQRPIEALDLTVRAYNALKNAGVKFVHDLHEYSDDEIMKIPNFGRKSFDDVKTALLNGLNEGPSSLRGAISAPKSNLIDLVKQALLAEDPRGRDILICRMGLETRSQTLQEIANRYSITRERVRQIESKAFKRLTRSCSLVPTLLGKITALLLGREYPLPVLGIEAVDDWFSGTSRSPDLLKYLVATGCEGKVDILNIDDIEFFARLSSNEWDNAVRQARQVLSSGAGQGWTRDYCISLVHALIPEQAREFRAMLWDKAARLCHFSDSAGGGETLASYGRGAEQIVEAILAESEMPLHYSEISERASVKAGKPVDIRRIHSAAAAIGILLGRGIYGLQKHLNLTAEAADALRDEVEEIILQGPEGRQWHASELSSILAERYPNAESPPSKYAIDAVLKQSRNLRRLGRLTWTKAGQTDAPGRIDLFQAIVAMIQQNGAPLGGAEIRQRLIALRGVNEFFQIPSEDPLLRIAPNVWGLNDRDVPIKRPQQEELLRSLKEALSQRGTGIHISELAEIGLPHLTAEVPPRLVFAIAGQDPALRVNQTQYVFLTEWGGPRRTSLVEAVSAILKNAAQPLSLDEIHAESERRMQRTCSRGYIANCLRAMDAMFDAPSGTWSRPSGLDDDDADDVPAIEQAPIHSLRAQAERPF